MLVVSVGRDPPVPAYASVTLNQRDLKRARLVHYPGFGAYSNVDPSAFEMPVPGRRSRVFLFPRASEQCFGGGDDSMEIYPSIYLSWHWCGALRWGN